MIIKHKKISTFILILFLYSCKESKLNDIITQDGIYIYKKNRKPVNGRITDNFENGKLSCEIDFKNGIPVGDFISYGYKGEIVGITKHQIVSKDTNGIYDANNIERLCITNYLEDKNEIIDLDVVLKQKSVLNYELLTVQLLDLVKLADFDVTKIETVYFCLGELERPFYELKTKELKK